MAEKYGKKTREMMIKELKDVFSGNKGFIFSSINNIKASQMDVLRKKMRRSGSKYMVIKNRLAKIALDEAGIEGFSDLLDEKDMLGVGVIQEDPVQITKLLMEFSKANSGFEVKKGYMEGNILASERVKELSKLPGREQLIAMVVGMMNSPINGFVGVLASVLRSLMYAIKAVKDKKEKEG